uniref:Small ribosomal subunit protein uS2m n=1 Tax=Hirondellea gigas TaxID=1518452 RepID=A0A2P2I3U2_9CRUS
MHFLKKSAQLLLRGVVRTGHQAQRFDTVLRISTAVSKQTASTVQQEPQQHSSPALPNVAAESHISSADWKRELVKSLSHPDYFNVVDMFTVEDLFKARLHLGHREGTLNPFMAPYLLGSRLSHLIIDLDQTVKHLHKALNFLAHITFRDGLVLFVCRQPQHQHMVENIAASCNEYAHTRWWAGGVLTNSTQQFSYMIRLPDVIILLSTHNHMLDKHIAVNDSAKMLIPTIGVVDTNCDPRLVTYPVPASDDSQASVEYLGKLFARAVMRGKEKRKLIRGEN